MTPQSGNQVSTSLGNSGLCWTVFARNRDTVVSAEGNGDLQTLICVFVARPRQCLTLLNPVPWQNWMAAYLGKTQRMKTLFRGWPVIVHDMHTRRSRRLRAHLNQFWILRYSKLLVENRKYIIPHEYYTQRTQRQWPIRILTVWENYNDGAVLSCWHTHSTQGRRTDRQTDSRHTDWSTYCACVAHEIPASSCYLTHDCIL